VNNKAQQYRNKNHVAAQTTANTENLQSIGQLIIPLSAKVFEMEKTIEALKRQLTEAKTIGTLAEYRATALQKLLGMDPSAVKQAIIELQKVEFQAKSDSDDKKRGLTNASGPATNGQIAIITGKIFKDGRELENEEVIGSKINLGEDDLFSGIDDQILGMMVNDIKMATFKVNEQEYQFHLQLIGLRNEPSTEGNVSEETEANS